MIELAEETRALESTTVGIYRTATVVKGGRRFSFAAMVVMGDRRGTVGLGYGKGRGVPAAIEKAEKIARKSLVKYTLKEGTIPHPVTGRYGASLVKLIPASPGTGVIAGGTVRAVLEMIGVHDCLTKSFGSNNQKNLCKATLNGLSQLRSKEDVSKLRGVEISTTTVDEILTMGKRFEPEVSVEVEKIKGPVNTVRKQKSGDRGGARGRSDSRAGKPPAAQPQSEPQATKPTDAGSGDEKA